MRTLPPHLRLPGRCKGCRTPVTYDGRRWRDTVGRGKGRAHACPEQRPTCGIWMAIARERCARTPGHGFEHRTRWALDNAMEARTGRRKAA